MVGLRAPPPYHHIRIRAPPKGWSERMKEETPNILIFLRNTHSAGDRVVGWEDKVWRQKLLSIFLGKKGLRRV